MVKIKILDRSINTTHFGFLLAGETYEVNSATADFVVDKMKAAERVSAPRSAADSKAKKGKK